VDFEGLGLDAESYLNGSDLTNGAFEIDLFDFPNDYNPDWMSWSGWAMSTMTDTTTPGYTNQYSSIAGSGNDGSTTYAVSFVSGHSVIRFDDNLVKPYSIQVTNATYTYLSMRDGDGFAKKFGGVDGTDPDFFVLTIKGFSGGEEQGSIDFYLADYRFDDNSMDYIVDEWTEIDLSSFPTLDSMTFTLNSSDTSSFGFNTPAYFCLDDMDWEITTSTEEELAGVNVAVFPNPTTDFLNVKWEEDMDADAFVFNSQGQLVEQFPLANGLQTVDVHTLPSGIYYLKIQTAQGWTSKRFVVDRG
jgi:hypothetical protein